MAHYEQCAAEGCTRRPRRRSRYCTTHYDRIRRNGSPHGRAIRKHELKPWRDIAAGWIGRNADHPAVVEACGYLAGLLEPTAGARFLGSEFDRLRSAGVTGADMLAAVIALWAWAEATGGRGIDDRCFDVNLGRAVLRCARQRIVSRSKSGKPDHKRVTGNHAGALGEELRLALGALPLVAAQRIVEEALGPERTRDRIREAMTEPFKSATDTD
ncbi:hypothetical protein [Luteimonas lutimaris]